MGEVKHLRKVEELFRKSPVVDAASVARIAGRDYSKQLLRNMERSGRIKRIVKGFYTTRDDPALVVFCLKSAYLGLQDALSFHGLWEQETIPVIITSRRVRSGLRSVMGQNVLVRRTGRKYLFGFGLEKQGDAYLPYSDIEKTLIDMVHFRQPLGAETLREIKKHADRKRLEKYLKAYPKRTGETVRTIVRK